MKSFLPFSHLAFSCVAALVLISLHPRSGSATTITDLITVSGTLVDPGDSRGQAPNYYQVGPFQISADITFDPDVSSGGARFTGISNVSTNFPYTGTPAYNYETTFFGEQQYLLFGAFDVYNGTIATGSSNFDVVLDDILTDDPQVLRVDVFNAIGRDYISSAGYFAPDTVTITPISVSSVPLPGAFAMFGSALLMLAFVQQSDQARQQFEQVE